MVLSLIDTLCLHVQRKVAPQRSSIHEESQHHDFTTTTSFNMIGENSERHRSNASEMVSTKAEAGVIRTIPVTSLFDCRTSNLTKITKRQVWSFRRNNFRLKWVKVTRWFQTQIYCSNKFRSDRQRTLLSTLVVKWRTHRYRKMAWTRCRSCGQNNRYSSRTTLNFSITLSLLQS